MTVKERLHHLVDQLPESMVPVAERTLEVLCQGDDPVLRALEAAPEDDEPETAEERTAVESAKTRLMAGSPGISHEEVRRRVLDSLA
ncbi:MAG: hypothetical protein HW403_848 [Dehalococcoidia bacterium]|nr:hypothetical protein [Dehalococcoidia bacterium]